MLKGQFEQIPNSFLRNTKDLSGNAVKVLLCLSSYNPSYPKYDVIQSNTGLSRQTIANSLNELEHLGYIKKQKGSNLKGKANTYSEITFTPTRLVYNLDQPSASKDSLKNRPTPISTPNQESNNTDENKSQIEINEPEDRLVYNLDSNNINIYIHNDIRVQELDSINTNDNHNPNGSGFSLEKPFDNTKAIPEDIKTKDESNPATPIPQETEVPYVERLDDPETMNIKKFRYNVLPHSKEINGILPMLYKRNYESGSCSILIEPPDEVNSDDINQLAEFASKIKHLGNDWIIENHKLFLEEFNFNYTYLNCLMSHIG